MEKQYTSLAKWLHWIMAVTIIALFALGLYMSDLPISPEKFKLFAWHKWAGVCIFILAVVRILWRLTHTPPTLPEHMHPLEKIAAHMGHYVLYLLMLLIPLSGWLMSSAKGFQTVLFGMLPIPDLLEKNAVLGNQLQQVHFSLNLFLAIVVLGHLAAALKHHFIDKDNVLTRMLPSRHS